MSPVMRVLSLAVLAFVASGASASPAAPVSLEAGGDARVTVPLESWKALRDSAVVRQRYDYSCGAAALATLLTYGFGQPASERDVLASILGRLSKDEERMREKRGLSLLDLKHEAEERGYGAQGFTLAPEFVTRLKGPVIVFIRPRGYDHFAVLRGVKGGRVHLADPAQGNVRMSMYRFLDIWLNGDGKGIIFVVETPGNGGASGLTVEPSENGQHRVERLSARQLLEVGNPFARLPELVP